MPRTPPFVIAIFGNPVEAKTAYARAVIDTGSTITVIPTIMAEELGLIKVGYQTLRLPDRTVNVPEYFCNIMLKDTSLSSPKGHLVVLTKHVLAMEQVPYPIIGIDIIQDPAVSEIFLPLIFGELANILRNITAIKKRAVLILGQDTSEIGRLRAIQARLNEYDYLGIIIKDITDIEVQSVEEKVNMFASLSKFVICENSTVSGHIDELKICANNRFVTAIIQEQGKGATWMQSDYCVDYAFIQTFSYPNVNEINSAVDIALQWAEKKVEERRQAFNKLYNWRSNSV